MFLAEELAARLLAYYAGNENVNKQNVCAKQVENLDSNLVFANFLSGAMRNAFIAAISSE